MSTTTLSCEPAPHLISSFRRHNAIDKPSSRQYHCSAIAQNRMYIFGGGYPLKSDFLWYLDLASYTWHQVNVHLPFNFTLQAFTSGACFTLSGGKDILIVTAESQRDVYQHFLVFDTTRHTFHKVNNLNMVDTNFSTVEGCVVDQERDIFFISDYGYFQERKYVVLRCNRGESGWCVEGYSNKDFNNNEWVTLTQGKEISYCIHDPLLMCNYLYLGSGDEGSWVRFYADLQRGITDFEVLFNCEGIASNAGYTSLAPSVVLLFGGYSRISNYCSDIILLDFNNNTFLRGIYDDAVYPGEFYNKGVKCPVVKAVGPGQVVIHGGYDSHELWDHTFILDVTYRLSSFAKDLSSLWGM